MSPLTVDSLFLKLVDIINVLSSKRSFVLVTIVCFSCVLNVSLKFFLLFEVTLFTLLRANWSKYVLNPLNIIRTSRLIMYQSREKNIVSRKS